MSALPEVAAADAPALGSPFGGGFFAGCLRVQDRRFALIVAPKAGGETRTKWKADWTVATPGTLSVSDGLANTEAMFAAGDHPAARLCRDLRIGGFDDWYLPARDELELLYRHFKPGTWANWVYRSRAARWGVEPGRYNGVDGNGNGHNASSDPPGKAYTKKSPIRTKLPAFRVGGSEAFAADWYWSSTEFSAAGAWRQYFGDGCQYDDYKSYDLRVRAVRKVLIS